MLSNYAGHSQFREGHGPLFGATATPAFFQNVVFSINDPEPPPTGGGGGGPSSVPEPSTYALMATGVALLAAKRKPGIA